MRFSQPLCAETNNRPVCDAALYGSIIMALRTSPINLYPRPVEDTLECSVASLAQLLQLIQLHYFKPEAPAVPPQQTNNTYYGRFEEPPKPPKPRDHSNCAVGMAASVVEALDVVQTPTLDSHRIHMQLQRGGAAKLVA